MDDKLNVGDKVQFVGVPFGTVGLLTLGKINKNAPYRVSYVDPSETDMPYVVDGWWCSRENLERV